jgi:hypothetical protein
MLPRLGGDKILRGYYKGRYRDKILAVVQAEVRIPVWWRFGVTAFAGAGDVADRPGRLRLADFKFSWGWGIRFKISPREGTNLRMDVGYGKNGSGFYLTANEAF